MTKQNTKLLSVSLGLLGLAYAPHAFATMTINFATSPTGGSET